MLGKNQLRAKCLLQLYAVVCISHLLVQADGLSVLEDDLHGGWEMEYCLWLSLTEDQHKPLGLSVLVPRLQVLLKTKCRE